MSLIDGLYVLNSHNEPVRPRSFSDYAAFARDFERRRVALTRSPDGEMVVSMVFLGMDHRCGGDGPPVLFESMYFGPDDENGDCERCCTWEDAELLHEAMCARYGLDAPLVACGAD